MRAIVCRAQESPAPVHCRFESSPDIIIAKRLCQQSLIPKVLRNAVAPITGRKYEGYATVPKDLANGDTLGLKAMLSGDAFMGRRGYPLLLASGETADGATHLVDRQHPHDLLMELAASYSHPVSDTDSLFLYGGYPGEPALGPSAYMHRVSAMDNPMTPIAHH